MSMHIYPYICTLHMYIYTCICMYTCTMYVVCVLLEHVYNMLIYKIEVHNYAYMMANRYACLLIYMDIQLYTLHVCV